MSTTVKTFLCRNFRHFEGLETGQGNGVEALALGLLFGQAITLLDFTRQNLFITPHLPKIVICKLAPLLLDFSLDLLPIPSDLIPIHVILLC
jgi:hypothetical protein